MRRAFTFVELLIVIVILGVLIGLLLPAISGAVNRANEARTEAQIDILAISLSVFKADHGDFPPSRLVFHESGYLGTPPTNGYYGELPHAKPYLSIGGSNQGPVGPEHALLSKRTVRAIRTLFPQLTVSEKPFVGGVFLGPEGSYYDINGNGTYDDKPILIEGHECLFLFLCGVPDWENLNGKYFLRGAGGFHRNPKNPFVAVPPDGDKTDRLKPKYEPSIGQLSDDDGDGIPGILDTLGSQSDARYLAYFSSSYGGYDPRDVELEPSSVADFGSFTSIGPNPWTTGPTKNARWVRAQSFQLLSPGRDRLYGPGGEQFGDENIPNDRKMEEDNIGMR